MLVIRLSDVITFELARPKYNIDVKHQSLS